MPFGQHAQGWKLFCEHKLNEAAEYFKEQVENNPKDALAWFWLGRTRAAEGAVAGYPRYRTNNSMLKAVEIDPALASFLPPEDRPPLSEAVADPAWALSRADNAVAQRPQDPRAWLERAAAQVAAHLFRSALLSCEKALALDVALTEAWVVKAVALHWLSFAGESESAAREAERLAPRDIGIRMLRHTAGWQALTDAGVLDKGHSTAHLWLKEGKPSDYGVWTTAARIACFRKALELDPACSAAWELIGERLLQAAAFEESAAAYRRATEVKGGKGSPHLGVFAGLGLDSHGRAPAGVDAADAVEAAEACLVSRCEYPHFAVEPPLASFLAKRALRLNPACREAAARVRD